MCFRLEFGFTLVSGELTASKGDHMSSQREFNPSRIHADVRKIGQLDGILDSTIGTGKDDNLVVNLTECIDGKMYARGDNSGDSDDEGSDHLNVQPEPSAQLDPETTQTPST